MSTQTMSYREARLFRRLVQFRLWLNDEASRMTRVVRGYRHVAPWYRLCLGLYRSLWVSRELVRRVAPGRRPLYRHEWDPGNRVPPGRPPRLL